MVWTLLGGQSHAELLTSLFRDLSCSISLSVASERGWVIKFERSSGWCSRVFLCQAETNQQGTQFQRRNAQSHPQVSRNNLWESYWEDQGRPCQWDTHQESESSAINWKGGFRFDVRKKMFSLKTVKHWHWGLEGLCRFSAWRLSRPKLTKPWATWSDLRAGHTVRKNSDLSLELGSSAPFQPQQLSDSTNTAKQLSVLP